VTCFVTSIAVSIFRDIACRGEVTFKISQGHCWWHSWNRDFLWLSVILLYLYFASVPYKDLY